MTVWAVTLLSDPVLCEGRYIKNTPFSKVDITHLISPLTPTIFVIKHLFLESKEITPLNLSSDPPEVILKFKDFYDNK